jgi:hypothetical protein
MCDVLLPTAVKYIYISYIERQWIYIYRVIHKSLRNFRTRLRNTKTYTVESSISIGTVSLHVFLCTRRRGVLAGFTARGQLWQTMGWIGNKKALCLEICQNWISCDGVTNVSDHVPNRTTYGQNNSWVVREIPAEWLPVRCETNRPTRVIGRDCRACARHICQVLDMSPGVDISSNCKVGQELGVSLPLLTCSPLAWPSRLLYRRGRKCWRDLWNTLYIDKNCIHISAWWSKIVNFYGGA